LECRRVLKDEGVLAFSFHHSREEGWAAIYEAIETAGLKVVAAHPVHAELRAASPKMAAKAPISIDAILVCRKRAEQQMGPQVDGEHIVTRTVELARRLEQGGMSISRADCFVIAASQTLISAADENLTFEQIEGRLKEVRRRIEDTNFRDEVLASAAAN
jgi:putative DNA methylase